MISIEKYIEGNRRSLHQDIMGNPLYGEKVTENIVVTGGNIVPPVVFVVDECVVFIRNVIRELSGVREDRYATQEYLDVLFWTFPVKGDMTLEGWRNNRWHFIGLLRNKGVSDEQIVERVNVLPVCCAAVVENWLFKCLCIDDTFCYAYNHLCVCRNGRERMSYQLKDVGEIKLRELILKERGAGEGGKIAPVRSFNLKYGYRKWKNVFAERLYCLLAEGPEQFIHETTTLEEFRGVLYTPNCMKEDRRIVWKCDTQDVYLIVKKLSGYISGLTFEHFGGLCVSKTGKCLKNLRASRTDTPRHKEEIERVFHELEVFLREN